MVVVAGPKSRLVRWSGQLDDASGGGEMVVYLEATGPVCSWDTGTESGTWVVENGSEGRCARVSS